MQKAWTQEQLDAFSTADAIHVSPFYSEGATPGTPYLDLVRCCGWLFICTSI